MFSGNIVFLLFEFAMVLTNFERFSAMWRQGNDPWSPTPVIVTRKEYEILRSPGSGASLLKTGQVYNYCAMHGICLLNRTISSTFLPLHPRHSIPAGPCLHCASLAIHGLWGPGEPGGLGEGLGWEGLASQQQLCALLPDSGKFRKKAQI